MKRVVFGFFGTTLDMPRKKKRGEYLWRPTISVFAHDDFLVDRFELFYSARSENKVQEMINEITLLSPESEIVMREYDFTDPWDFEEVFSGLHDFSRSYPFDLDNEEYYVHITTGSHVMQISWFLLAESRHFPAKLLQSSPAPKESDALGSYRVIDLDISAYDSLRTRFERERVESLDFLKSGIETRNLAFNQMIENIERVALRSKEPILLTGPTGAGKSHLAKQIFRLKEKRKLVDGDLVEVNCATIRGDGAMSALFGHAKGAFTGAANARKGYLRAADKGMLFLDEIGELGLEEQAMLLRAIENKTFFPVGVDKEVSSDFLLIAGTNRDLRIAVREGRFREDLFARINLWTFELPGLANRPEDIEPNLDFEIARISKDLGRITINQEARDRFLRFALAPTSSWRGNFRDLGASVKRMATLAPKKRIDAQCVTDEIKRLEYAWAVKLETKTGAEDPLQQILSTEQMASLDLFDRDQLISVINVCRESKNLSDAGRKLFAESRKERKTKNDADRLRKYLQKFDLTWRDLH